MAETILQQSESIVKFAPAFVKAQSEIQGASKDKANPFFNSKYADLSSVMDACKDVLNKHGIAIIQRPEPTEAGMLCLTTQLLHESGEWIASTGSIPAGKADPQGYGSALTYARRYFLAAMAGVCPEDDDAEAASGRPQQQQRRTAPPADTKADPSRVAELAALCATKKVPESKLMEWRGKAGVTKFADAKAETVEGLIKVVAAMPDPPAPKPAPKDPGIEFEKFMSECEGAAQEAGLTPGELTEAMKKYAKANKADLVMVAHDEAKRKQVLELIKNRRGYFTPAKPMNPEPVTA